LSELLAAVYSGDQARVDELLAGDPELDVFEAAALGHVERLETLLDSEPGLVAAWAEDGFTPLHLAAFFRHPEAARLLVERGALVDVVARNEELIATRVWRDKEVRARVGIAELEPLDNTSPYRTDSAT